MKKILLIDDDTEFGELICTILTDAGYEVNYTQDAYIGLSLEKENNYDLLIIDLYLQKLKGTQLVEIIRNHNKTSKIIIMTNSSDDNDEVKALQLGIDEYLRKSTSISIMLQRIKNTLKANIKNSLHVYESRTENIKVDVINHIIIKDDAQVHLTQLEIDLLVCFLSNVNTLLSRETILKTVWKLDSDELYIDSRTVDVHVKNLRRKLKIKSIHSVRGIGYRWYEE